uniref:RIC1 C-terminal alpha solenoid region domain-containing protein n=1 Tax=Physcomitrium patens TaxID=3218 RepID=A0A7I4D4R9_PHYPA
MYVAYGWPKLLSIGTSSPQPVVHLSVQAGWLLLVTSTQVQVWSADQHTTKLGQFKRELQSREGANIHALWSEKGNTVAVLTSESYLHFYHIKASEKQLRSSVHDNLELTLVNVIFSSSVDVALYNRSVTVSCIAGDVFNIILGLSNNCLRIVSWSGEVLGVSDVLQDFVPASEAIHSFEANRAAVSPSGGLVHQSSFPLSPRLPLSPVSVGDDTKIPKRTSGLFQLLVSAELRLLVAIFTEGTVALCNVSGKGSKQGTEITPERWIGVFDAVCASIAHDQQYLAVGTKRGSVELFNLADSASYLRTISLVDWGYAVEDTGPVSQVIWTPDNRAFAVGWKNRGLAVWSASGCRLMCTIRQGSLSNSQSPSLRVNSDRSMSEPMVQGVGALAWGHHAYELYAVERGSTLRFFEFRFAKSSSSQNIAGITDVWQLMHGADRVLLVQSDENNDVKSHHLVIPHSYILDNWPILQVAGNEDGTYLAIAGRQGLILHDVQVKKWRVFGDVLQERQVHCVGVVWLGKIVVLCNHRKISNSYELCLYPRYHLDETSLLYRKQLPGKPIALDVWQDYILVTCPPFDIYVFKVHVQGELSPLRSATVQLFTVRELSIMSSRKSPVAMHFVPNVGPWSEGMANSWDSPRVGTNVYHGSELPGEAAKQPTRCMILRTDGELSLLDLDHGNERRLLSGVERFWLSNEQAKVEADPVKEDPCWAYGPQGMQVWYPSSTSNVVQSPSVRQLEPELDFDREVYPLGLSPAAGIIVGISQRLTLSGCILMPCFEPTPQAQPILPCLLWHLLQRNKSEDALQLAKLSEGLPHFSHSLEWLLFTVFDAAMSSQSTNKRRGRNIAVKRTIFLLLQQVCNLIHNFQEYLDVLVSVARKTDSRHWPELFAVAGNSIKLFEECLEKGLYRTATCYILVIEKLEGPTISQHNAIRLLKVRFLLRCGREDEAQEKEVPRYGNGLISSLLGLTISTPWVEKEQNFAVVKRTLEEHASFLMRKLELRDLVAFVKATQFDFTAFLYTERGKAARLDDFASSLLIVGQKLNMDELEGRQDAEFLLTHMCSVGFQEWTVVLATLLRRVEVLLETFHGDSRLWQAYSHTLQGSPMFAEEYKDLLAALELEMSITNS